MIESCSPVVDNESRVLILGTMPGKVSIKKGEYYANKGNHFWKIIYSIFDSELKPAYADRLAFLSQNHIALWDVLETCERAGSSDGYICQEIPNDFINFFIRYPNINCVFFNGKSASDMFNKTVPIGPEHRAGLKFRSLSSTSGLNSYKTLGEKIREWETIADYA